MTAKYKCTVLLLKRNKELQLPADHIYIHKTNLNEALVFCKYVHGVRESFCPNCTDIEEEHCDQWSMRLHQVLYLSQNAGSLIMRT